MSRTFGILADGRAVRAFDIGRVDGLRAEVLEYGAMLRRLTIAGAAGPLDLILSLPDLQACENDRAYLGVVAGRVANRIGASRFDLDGRTHRLTPNEGPNHLHGGALGLGKRLWRTVHADADEVVLAYDSPGGEEGYPGRLEVRARYRIEGLALTLELEARCDAPTPVSLTGHAYFNLSGDPRAPLDDHRLRLPASRYLPVDDALLPTGELRSVGGGAFDFRQPRPVVAPPPYTGQLAPAAGYDHCWLIDPGADCHAELRSETSGVTMTLRAGQPGLQFYGGQGLPRQQPDLGHGLCLEPQGLPDAVNRPAFPPVILRPGERWSERILYQFNAKR